MLRKFEKQYMSLVKVIEAQKSIECLISDGARVLYLCTRTPQRLKGVRLIRSHMGDFLKLRIWAENFEAIFVRAV